MNAGTKIKASTGFRTVSSLTLLMIGFYAVYSWALAPHVAYVKAVQSYEPVAQTLHQQTQALQTTLDDNEEILQELHAQFSTVRRMLFTPPEKLAFSQDLESLAQTRACSLGEVVMDKQTSTATREDKRGHVIPIEEIEVMVKIQGERAGIQGFVHDLQTYKRKLFLRSVVWEASRLETQTLTCEIGLTLYEVQATGIDI